MTPEQQEEIQRRRMVDALLNAIRRGITIAPDNELGPPQRFMAVDRYDPAPAAGDAQALPAVVVRPERDIVMVNWGWYCYDPNSPATAVQDCTVTEVKATGTVLYSAELLNGTFPILQENGLGQFMSGPRPVIGSRQYVPVGKNSGVRFAVANSQEDNERRVQCWIDGYVATPAIYERFGLRVGG